MACLEADTCHRCARLPDRARLRSSLRHLAFASAFLRSSRHRAEQSSKSKGKCRASSRSSTLDAAEYLEPDQQVAPDCTKFEGLGWVQEQEDALRGEQDASIQVPHARPLQNARTIDETDPRRHHYHRELHAGLARGSSDDVEETLQLMQAEDLEPGPLAYNLLVVAYVKDRDRYAALGVIDNMHHQGLQPIQQTYCALIYSFASDGQLQQAEDVLRQMPEAQMQSGWLVLVKQLLARGHTAAAQTCLRLRSQQWSPDGDIYEHIIRNVCKDPSDDASYLLKPRFMEQQQGGGPSWTEDGSLSANSLPAQNGSSDSPAVTMEASGTPSTAATVNSIWLDMRERQVLIEARHCNPLLQFHAQQGDTRAAENAFKIMRTGIASVNAASFELLAEAYVAADEDRLEYQLNTVTKNMAEMGLQPTKKMNTLGLEASLRRNNLEGAWSKLDGLMRTAGLGAMQQLSDGVLASVLWKLSCSNRPADLRRVLRSMDRDSKRIGSSQLQQDEQGRSFLTVWLAARPRSSVQGFHRVEAQPEAPEISEVTVKVKQRKEVVEMTFRILRNKFVLGEGDKILPPSSQTVPQMTAELTARQLSTEGKRDDLKKRLMAARSSDPPDMAEELRQSQKSRQAKYDQQMRREQARKEARRGGAAAERGSTNKQTVVSKHFSSGAEVEQVETEVDEEEEQDDDADEGLVTVDDPMQLAKASEEADDEDLGGEYGEGREERTRVSVSPAAAPVQQEFTNSSAGADAAWQLLRLARSVNAAATAADYRALLEAAEHEVNASVAWSLVRSWHDTLLDAFDGEMVEDMYNRALTVCTKVANSDLALEVVRIMLQHGYTPLEDAGDR